MRLSEELTWRGLVNQTTLEDLSVLDGDPISLYFGVDPSGHGMQIGNLAAAMMVRRFVEHGHKVFLLVGGATGLIGDPDGKLDERNLKALEEIADNKQEIARQYTTVFNGKDFTLVDNYDWFQDINYLDFLRDIGKHVPMSQMLGREFIQTRLGEGGSGISYAEFSYALIQGYDFLHLYREYGVTLQLCGADQWGNSIAGVELIRRIEGGEAHIYSLPLIMNKATGRKFGKSEGGTIWLDSNLTSVYKFYQFWLNVDDEGVIDYMKVYTTLDKSTIEAIAENHAINPGARSAQKVLAREVTDIVHGTKRRESVERVTEVLFGGGGMDALSDEDITVLEQEIPTTTAQSVIEALVSTGAVSSNGEARRLLSSGGISVNGEKIHEDQAVTRRDLIKKGKNTFILVSERGE